MKFLLTILLILCLFAAKSQTIPIYGDTIKILSRRDNAELILLNSTRAVKGFLYNDGTGKTSFHHGAIKINDSLWLIGADTLKLKANAGGITTQANSDWNATSGVAQILNKPAIPAQVNLIAGTGISITGTYPNKTITASTPNFQTVLDAGSSLNKSNNIFMPPVTNFGFIAGAGSSSANFLIGAPPIAGDGYVTADASTAVDNGSLGVGTAIAITNELADKAGAYLLGSKIDNSQHSTILSRSNGAIELFSSSNQFKFNTLTYAFPTTNAAGILTNNGSGALTWASTGGTVVSGVVVTGTGGTNKYLQTVIAGTTYYILLSTSLPL